MRTTLDQLEIGDSAQILTIAEEGEHTCRKLMNLGLFPGSQVSVLQRSPAYLLQAGFTQIALDEKTCKAIHVIIDNL